MTAGEPALDGRAARSARTRATIVDAHVRLLAGGNLRPTAEQITTEAGVSVRSLWLHFAELETLFEATSAEILARQDRAFHAVDPSLDLPHRIVGFCRQRAALLEAVAPFARASSLREPFSATLRAYHRRHVERVRDEVRTLFAPELGAMPEGVRATALHGVVAATTWGAWSTLRDDLRLSRSRSRDVMARTVRALLTEPADPAGFADPEAPTTKESP